MSAAWRRHAQASFTFIAAVLVLQALVVGSTELYRLVRGKGTIVYSNIPFPTDSETYVPGDAVHFRADVQVVDLATERSTYVVTPELHRVNCESVYQLTTFTTASTEHRQSMHYTITIPRDIPSGRYEIQGVSRWSSDSMAGGVAWSTQPFTVTGSTSLSTDAPCQ